MPPVSASPLTTGPGELPAKTRTCTLSRRRCHVRHASVPRAVPRYAASPSDASPRLAARAPLAPNCLPSPALHSELEPPFRAVFASTAGSHAPQSSPPPTHPSWLPFPGCALLRSSCSSWCASPAGTVRVRLPARAELSCPARECVHGWWGWGMAGCVRSCPWGQRLALSARAIGTPRDRRARSPGVRALESVIRDRISKALTRRRPAPCPPAAAARVRRHLPAAAAPAQLTHLCVCSPHAEGVHHSRASAPRTPGRESCAPWRPDPAVLLLRGSACGPPVCRRAVLRLAMPVRLSAARSDPPRSTTRPRHTPGARVSISLAPRRLPSRNLNPPTNRRHQRWQPPTSRATESPGPARSSARSLCPLGASAGDGQRRPGH